MPAGKKWAAEEKGREEGKQYEGMQKRKKKLISHAYASVL